MASIYFQILENKVLVSTSHYNEYLRRRYLIFYGFEFNSLKLISCMYLTVFCGHYLQ